MKLFEQLIASQYAEMKLLREEGMADAMSNPGGGLPPPPPPSEGMDMGGGGGGGGGGMPPGMGDPSGGEGSKPEDLENDTKREADPMAYTESVLRNLVDTNAGVDPAMFNEFINQFGLGLNKIRDKEGFKKFYADFYRELQRVMAVQEKLKGMYKELHGELQDVLRNQKQEPNQAGNETSSKGPGVK